MLNATFTVIFKHCAFFALFLINFSIFPYHIQPLEVTVGKDSDEELNRLEIPEKRVHRFHVLANRRSMGPRKKKTHWMANFLLEAKGYQNAASWKNGSAFRLDERRDDLVGQKPN